MAFLGFESFLVPLGASVEDVKSTFRSALTSRGWQVVYESAPIVAALGTLGSGVNTNTNAFDLTASSVAANTAALPLWLGVQTVTAFTPVSMTIGIAVTAGQAPSAFSLDYSDDGSTWTTLQSWNNEVFWQSWEHRTYAVSGAAAHAYWRLNITAGKNNADSFTSIATWELQDAAGRKPSNIIYFQMLPPASEPVGNARTRSLVHMEFAANYIRTLPVMELLQYQPQVVALYPKTAGAVAAGVTFSTTAAFSITASCTTSVLNVTATSGVIGVGTLIWADNKINAYVASLGTGAGGPGTYNLNYAPGTVASMTMTGQAVTTINGPVGSAGNTATQNLRALYETLAQSSDSVALDYTWEYQYAPPQNANDTNDYIYGTRKSSNYSVINVNANVNGYQLGLRQMPFMQKSGATYIEGTTCDITTDLVNGFIYYLQVNSRALALATKTNVSFYGPVHTSYSEHTRALNALPIGGGTWTNPIELVVGYDNDSNSQDSIGYTTHTWCFRNAPVALASQLAYYQGNYTGGLFNGPIYRDRFVDILANNYSLNWPGINLRGSGFANADTATDDFQVHRVNQVAMGQGAATSSGGNGVSLIPILDIPDWFKFRGTAVNESLLLVADTVAVTTLAQALDSITAYTSLNLTSTAGFQTSGYVVVENEVFQYTGVTGNTLTGVTRAKYATVMSSHFNGASVSQGIWFVVINGGALLAGYNKPS